MHPCNRQQRLITILLLSSIALAPSATAAADFPELVASRSESPDGDAAFQVFQFPASLFPLRRVEEGAAPPPPLASLSTSFVLTGSLPEGDTPSAAAFTPDGTKIIVAHRDTRNLIVFDAATRIVLGEVPLSGSPNDVAVSSDGVRAVTANVFENTASIVNLTTGAETAVVPVGTQPGVARISPDGTTAVIGNTVESSLSVIDLATATELRRISGLGFVGTISVSFEPGAITAAFSPFEFAGNTKVVHPDFYAHRIRIADITTGAVTSLVSANNPRGVAVTPDGTKAVVAHFLTARTVTVVDVPGQAIVKTIATPVDLDGTIAVDPGGTKAVVAVQNACRVVNLITDVVSGALNTLSVNQLLTTADGNYAVAVGFAGSLIQYSSETIVRQLNNVVSTAFGAVSPAGPRAAMVANTFGEDMVVANTNGAGGFIEGVVPSGPPPEGDKARTAAIRADGSKAVVANILSDNASIVDLGTRTVEAIVAVGNRPAEVEVTPDGTKAVVANLDSDFVSVIDIASHAVSNVVISTRGSEVEISPDGHYAYIAVVVSDGVWRVDLTTLAVAGPRLTTGNMGGVLYLFSQSSGMTLSHDGATLVTCNSFSNTISIIDTAAWAVVATVPVGAFPTRAVFSADDSRVHVANRDGDSITVVANAGGGSTVIGTIPVGDYPFEMVIAPGGATLYVANFQARTIGVVDLVGGIMTSAIPVPDPPQGLALAPAGDFLYVTSGNWSVSVGPGPLFSIARSGQFSVIDTATRLIAEQVVTGLPPAMLAWNAAGSFGGVPSPFGDGLTLIGHLSPAGIGEPAGAPGLRIEAPAPNPFDGEVALGFSLARETAVALAIHDVAGRAVAVLASGARGPGRHAVTWDGRGAGGRRVAPGVYFLRLEAGGEVRSARVAVR